MKKLGTLYGADLLIDTDDDWIFQHADKLLKGLFEKEFRIKTDEELHQELAKALAKPHKVNYIPPLSERDRYSVTI